jgi:hypothetical protein
MPEIRATKNSNQIPGTTQHFVGQYKVGLEELGADVHLGHALGKGKVRSILAWGVLMSIHADTRRAYPGLALSYCTAGVRNWPSRADFTFT